VRALDRSPRWRRFDQRRRTPEPTDAGARCTGVDSAVQVLISGPQVRVGNQIE
jgi:hypothetical protein